MKKEKSSEEMCIRDSTGLLVERGVPVLNSILVACVVYLLTAPLLKPASAIQENARAE